MATLTQTKTALVDSLKDAGYPVRDHVPEKVNPPAVVIEAGDPYLTPGDTFDVSQMTINLSLWLFVPNGTNQKQTVDLDRMVATVLPHIPGNWTVQVDKPDLWTINATVLNGCRIAISTLFDLG